MGRTTNVATLVFGFSLTLCGCSSQDENAVEESATSSGEALPTSTSPASNSDSSPGTSPSGSATSSSGETSTSTTTAPSTTTGAFGSSSGTPETGPRSTVADDEWIARFEGQWAGEMLDGPNGDYLDYSMGYHWNKDGSMESNVVLSSGSTMDFRFLKVDGIWEMREGVAVPNGGSHSNRRMSQLSRDGDRVRWVWNDEDPEDAWVDVTVTANAQVWDVWTRSCGHAPGERHALINVTRP